MLAVGAQDTVTIHTALQNEPSPIVQAKSTLFGMALHGASNLTLVLESRVAKLPVTILLPTGKWAMSLPLTLRPAVGAGPAHGLSPIDFSLTSELWQASSRLAQLA